MVNSKSKLEDTEADIKLKWEIQLILLLKDLLMVFLEGGKSESYFKIGSKMFIDTLKINYWLYHGQEEKLM